MGIPLNCHTYGEVTGIVFSQKSIMWEIVAHCAHHQILFAMARPNNSMSMPYTGEQKKEKIPS